MDCTLSPSGLEANEAVSGHQPVLNGVAGGSAMNSGLAQNGINNQTT